MQSRIKHLLKHFALVLKAKLNQLKPFVRFVFHPSTLPSSPTYRIIKGLHIQTLFILLYASFSCPYWEYPEKEINKLVESLEAKSEIYIRILTYELENEYVSFRTFSQGKWTIK